MLKRQYHLYSVDTEHFFSGRERYWFEQYVRYRKELHALRESHPETKQTVRIFSHKRKKLKSAKKKLLTLFANKVSQNERTNGADHIRVLEEKSVKDSDVISVFESSLSRTIGIKENELTDTLIIVRVYYYSVFKDLSFYGFLYKGEKYRYFTSSAGQIRNKKAMFIKEAVWTRIEKTVMCGLTLDKINAKGGNNVNKHLAYLALACSATDHWEDFPIDHTIVIDDFETEVYGTYDLVDETDYSVTRQTGYIPICHTDGAGMMLPSVSEKNFMFRAPFIKGLLCVFDFRRFIRENECSPVIRDIYGNEHNVIEEDIRIILTKSQFKMYKYYDSFEQYKACFKKYLCAAGRCNTEEERIKNAKLNYQMLQTLTDVTEKEFDSLTEKSVRKIKNICQSKETMMDLLGITPYNTNPTPFQRAVKAYPDLLNDAYTKDLLREIKESLLKKYRSGKLEITGKYTFLLPDFYAACEYWFGRVKKPAGLLKDGEVFCNLFPKYEKLDCLRSPHLYREHAVRQNTASRAFGERAIRIGAWFTTNAIYTSTHDFISKLLQFDVDGDKSLVVADPNFVTVAERNMKDIVPLYYNMKKAAPSVLNKETIFNGLCTAFSYGNIGLYSNSISKIWNHDVFRNGTEAEKKEVLSLIKLLCMENNFCIDAAKTLYMPDRAEWFGQAVAKYTNARLPAFFLYAKGKDAAQTEEPNQSLVNRIYDKIPNVSIRMRSLQLAEPDFRIMMSDPMRKCEKKVSELYNKQNRQYRSILYRKDDGADNLAYTALKIRKDFQSLGHSDEVISDMLIEYLYGGNKRYKRLLWFCYGDLIIKQLEKNLPPQETRLVKCPECGEWMETEKNSRQIFCECCRKEKRSAYNRKIYQNQKFNKARGQ